MLIKISFFFCVWFRYAGYLYDTVQVIGEAITRVLLHDDCSSTTDLRAVRNCLTGPRLLAELKNTDHRGYSGRVLLDTNGDRIGRFKVAQVSNN